MLAHALASGLGDDYGRLPKETRQICDLLAGGLNTWPVATSGGATDAELRDLVRTMAKFDATSDADEIREAFTIWIERMTKGRKS